LAPLVRQVSVGRGIDCGTAQAPEGQGIEAVTLMRLIHEVKAQCRNQYVTPKAMIVTTRCNILKHTLSYFLPCAVPMALLSVVYMTH
jgi:hypothetical protein